MKLVVGGMIGTFPVGGVFWDYAQYALGFERLGAEVTYVEDAGCACYDAGTGSYGLDGTAGAAFLTEALAAISPRLAQRWCFRAPDGVRHGPLARDLADVVAEADAFVNVSGGCLLRDELALARRRVFIDTDPGWNHFVVLPRADRAGPVAGGRGWREHDVFLTYATRLGATDCPLPDLGVQWIPTRPPVVPDLWQREDPATAWTTVLTWDDYWAPIEHAGRTYGGKEREFRLVEHLPARVSVPLEVALGGVEPPVDRCRRAGWRVVSAPTVTSTPGEYRRYLQGSRGELSVAKNVYVAARTGWFSCRSVCYLAAGRFVVVQDTGFTEVVPTGAGLHAFTTADQAVAALSTVEADYERESAAARRMATDVFAADVVLSELLEHGL